MEQIASPANCTAFRLTVWSAENATRTKLRIPVLAFCALIPNI
jgi:hypothetical protein